jgi:hypothetical protein
MADNVAFQTTTLATPAGGTNVATDDVAGVHFQRVKLVDGTLDSTTAIPGDATNGLDVDVTRLPALVAGTANIGDVDVLTVPAPLSTTGGGTEATAHRVTIANDSTGVLSVDDNGGSLTVDGTVTVTATDLDVRNLAHTQDSVRIGDGTDLALVSAGGALLVDASATTQPVSGTVTANLAAGSNNIGDVDVLSIAAGDNNIGNVDIVTMPNVTLAAGTNTNEVVGDVAQDAAIAGNPVGIGMRASTAIPTAMSADGDNVYPWANRQGLQMVSMAPHLGLFGTQPWNLTSETAQYTTTQTSTALVAGGASERIVVTSIQIQVGGTTAGTLQVYFGTDAYSRGTNLAIFDGEFAPSATSKPGVVMQGPFISATNGDDILVTTSAAINPLTVTVWYYIVT